MKALILVATLSSLALSAAAPAQAGSFKFLSFGQAKLSPQAAVSLNPQPIPPGGETSIIIVGGKGALGSLNPQPLPPGSETGIIIVGGKGEFGSLNPQPIPPRFMGGFVSLNPQPIPPKEAFGGGLMF